MGGFFPIPSPERVRDACAEFDRKNKIVEEALRDLFDHFPLNTNSSHVLLKAIALNRLYSAGILAVEAMASHISRIGDETDTELANGSPTIVDKIAKVTFHGRDFTFFSFATKYCNWHKPDFYPIYDSRVDRYIWSLQLHSRFSDLNNRSEIRKDNTRFLDVMTKFKSFYGLGSFTFKEIDKFLWSQEVMDSPGRIGLEHYMDMVPDVAPEPGDELPEGRTAQ
jgi:hypothetical protein